jgi:hypothetical protein
MPDKVTLTDQRIQGYFSNRLLVPFFLKQITDRRQILDSRRARFRVIPSCDLGRFAGQLGFDQGKGS